MYTQPQHPHTPIAPQNITYKTVMSPASEPLPRRLSIQDAPGFLQSLLPQSKTDLVSRILITLTSGHIFGLVLRALPASPVVIALTLVVIVAATLSLWCVSRYAPQSNAVVASIVTLFAVGFFLTWVA